MSAIGAFQDVVLGYFDWERKDYKRIPLDEQVEVVSMNGDIAMGEGTTGRCETRRMFVETLSFHMVVIIT